MYGCRVVCRSAVIAQPSADHFDLVPAGALPIAGRSTSHVDGDRDGPVVANEVVVQVPRLACAINPPLLNDRHASFGSPRGDDAHVVERGGVLGVVADVGEQGDVGVDLALGGEHDERGGLDASAVGDHSDGHGSSLLR